MKKWTRYAGVVVNEEYVWRAVFKDIRQLIVEDGPIRIGDDEVADLYLDTAISICDFPYTEDAFVAKAVSGIPKNSLLTSLFGEICRRYNCEYEDYDRLYATVESAGMPVKIGSSVIYIGDDDMLFVNNGKVIRRMLPKQVSVQLALMFREDCRVWNDYNNWHERFALHAGLDYSNMVWNAMMEDSCDDSPVSVEVTSKTYKECVGQEVVMTLIASRNKDGNKVLRTVTVGGEFVGSVIFNDTGLGVFASKDCIEEFCASIRNAGDKVLKTIAC